MKVSHSNADMDTEELQCASFIGRAKLTTVAPLAGGLGQPGTLTALGNVPTPLSSSAEVNLETPKSQASLASFDFLVAGAHGNLEALLKTASSLKRLFPELKVVLVDSEEQPLLLDELPQGVESVMMVTKEQAELGRSLLLQQAGLLAGTSAGMAAYVAFIMEARMEVGAKIAIATTNLSPRLLCLNM